MYRLKWQRGWERGREVLYGHGTRNSASYRSSPVPVMMKNKLPMLRRRLVGEDAQLDFPILEELRDEGATDYLAMPSGLRGSSAGFFRWTSDDPAGFGPDDIVFLRQVKSATRLFSGNKSKGLLIESLERIKRTCGFNVSRNSIQ